MPVTLYPEVPHDLADPREPPWRDSNEFHSVAARTKPASQNVRIGAEGISPGVIGQHDDIGIFRLDESSQVGARRRLVARALSDGWDQGDTTEWFPVTPFSCRYRKQAPFDTQSVKGKEHFIDAGV